MAYGDDNRVEPGSQEFGVEKVNTLNGVETNSGIDSDFNGMEKEEKVQSAGLGAGLKGLSAQSAEDEAQATAQVEYSTGVTRVQDELESEEFPSAKSLYEKTLGVTEYDELRAKLHLRDDESFTEYYERTHYIPKGFEVQARLLLAEEKRKKLYNEVAEGRMSEEDFLYEAYGKDLLKRDGVDFSSSLYWYNRYKGGDYTDPRKNDTYMLQLIENARTMFERETWYEAIANHDVTNLAKYVTGETLDAEQVKSLFADQFEMLSEYFDNEAEVIKYYRAGLLQGFQPTIDTDGDGKIDYYYAPDGKLYNVNETGQGANTARAYYNSDGSLNRIVVSGKDSLLAEGVMQTLKGFASFFTGVVDFVGLVTGATADLVEWMQGKGWDLSATTEAQANLSQFWNSGFLGDQDYVVTQGLDDVATWVRGGGRLLGTIGAFFATMGMSKFGEAGGAASKAATTATKKGLLGTVKQGFSNLKAMGVKKAITSAPKGIAKSLANTAVRLTSFANGTTASGTIGAMAKNAATTALKDSLQAAVTLSVNAPMLYEQGVIDHELTGGDILGLSFATFGLEFATGMLLRSACNTTAVDRFKTYRHWGTISKETSKTLLTYAPQSIKFAKAGLGTNVLRISNLAMDAIDNIVCQTAQTSLATKGQLFNFDVLGQTLSNPSVLMNIAWQTKSNIRDNWGISNDDIVFANTNAAENLLSLKDWVHKQAINANTPQDAENWRAIGKDIDTRHAQELANIRANAPQGTKVEAAAAMKVFEDTSQKLGLFKDTELPKFTKKLTAEEVDKLDPVQRYAYKMWEIRSTMEFEYTNAIIDTINNYYDTYNNITKKVLRWGYRSVFGDGVKDAIVKSSQAFLAKVINDDRALEWEAALGAAFKKSEKYEECTKLLDGKGTEFLEILDKSEVDMVKVKRDEEGKIIFEGGLIDKLKDKPETLAEYQKWIEDQSGQGKLLQATQSVYILTSNTGTALDGNETRSKSIAALDTIYKLFNILLPNGEGGNLKIEKFGDGAAYLIKFNGLGDHVLTLQQVSGMLQSIAALRLSLGEDTDLSNTKSVTILKTFLQLLSDAPSDELLTTDADVTITAQVINELLANKLITHLEAARLIQGLNSHIAELNKDTDGPKSMLKLDKALSATGVLNTNKDTSVDMSNYDTAQRLADALPKVEEALRTIQDLQTKSKTEATRKSDQDKLLRAKEALKDDTVNEILVKGGLIHKDFRSKLNPFTPGLKVNNHVRPTQANESNVVNRETLHQELVKRFNVGNEEGELKYTRDDGVTLSVGKKAKNKAVISLGDIDDNHQGFHKYLQAQNNRAEDLEFLKKNTNPKKRSTILTQLTKLKDKASAEDKATIDRILADYTEYATKTVVEIFKAKDYQDVDFKETLDTIADAFNKAYPNNAPIDAKYLRDLFSNPSEEGIELIKGLITEGIISPRQFTAKILSTRDTYQDNFAELHQKYSNLTHNSKMKAEELHTSDKVVIRLNECMGDAFEGALRRLNNPIIAENVASKTNESEIYAELFPSGKIKEFKRQYVVWKQLRELYGDEIVLPQAEAAEILKLLGYNFNGDFLYVNSERQVPGVYFITNQQGYNLGSSDSLAKLEYLANKRATTSDTSEVILTTDAISKAQTLSGNITYITERSQIDINEVVLKPKFVPGTEAASSYIKELTNNKSGKLASQTPTADREFKTFVGSNEYNETHRTAIYVNQIVNKLSELYKDSYNKKSPVVEGPLVTFNNKEAADAYVNDIKNSGLWDANILPVDNAQGNVQVQVTLKVGLTQEEFCNKAFGLIKDNDGKLTYDIIKVLIPNNINEPQETTIVAKGVGASSKSSGQLISGYIYNFMRASHDMDETQFFKLLQLSNEVKIGDISNEAYKAAIAETKGENGEPLTAGQILAKRHSDNIFFNIIKGSIHSTLAISKALRARVTELACENSKSPSATSAWISTLLGSDDMRRDIGSALNTVLSKDTKKHFDDKGNLIITPELLKEIRDTVKLVTTSDAHDFEEIKLAIASDEALSGYLQLLSITMIKKPRGKLTQDTLAQKLYAAIRSATHTGSEDIHISIKDLFRLSDEDLTAGPNEEPAPVNQILRDIGAKEIPQEILDTIVNSGVRYKYQEKPTTNYKLAQTEKVSNTFDSAFGTIVQQDTNAEGSPKFQIGNNEPSDSLTIDDTTVKNMFARGASINNGELAFKLSVAMDERYDNPIHQKLIADSQQRSGLLNFVNYPSTGSLTRANFNYSLVKYRHFNNIITIAEDLHQLEGFNHLDSEQLVNLVCNLYDLSTGTQMASVRPEYALVDAPTGNIIDVSTFIKHEDDYSSYDGIIAALAAHNLLDSDKAHDIQIIKLKQNGFNTLYGDAVDPIEVYSLAENVSAFNAMIAHRRAQLDNRNNYSSTDKTASDEALKNYYANILVDSPSHHNNLVRECAASADIPEEAIQSLLTSIQSISVLSNTNTAAEESFKTLLGENRDDSRAYYQLQQLRDLQSFGETKESLEKIPGLKDTLAQANDEFFGRIDQKYLDEHQKTFDDIIEYFDEGNTDLVTKAINFMLKDAPLEDRVEIVKNLLMYAIYKDNSIESTLFKLSGQTLGEFIQKEQTLNNVQAFKWDNTKKEVASTSEFINIGEAVKKPRLVIDIERLYSKGVESRTYQIAYRYVKDNNTVDEGVIFLKNPNEHTTAQALLEQYPDFAKEYGENNSIKWFIEGLPDEYKGYEKDLAALHNIIAQANNDGAYLLGSNSNVFDIPALLEDPKLAGYVEGLQTLTCLDTLELSKRLPTTFNIIQTDHKLRLGETATQLGIKVDKTKQHDALYDIELTNEVFRKLADKAIEQENHGSKFASKIQNIFGYKQDPSDPSLPDKILEDIRYTDANTIDATIKGRIDTAIAHRQDPDRLYKFTLVLNALNNRLVANNVNVRRKELKALLDRNQLHTVHTLHAALASPVKRSRLFSAVKLYLVGGLAQDKDIPTNPDELTYALNKFNSWICKTYKVDSLNNDTLTQILKDPEDLISKILFEVKVSTEDFNKLEATYGDSLTQSLVKEFSDVTSKSIAEDSALYYLDRALKPLKDYLRDVFLPSIEVDSTIRNEAEERILDSMQRMLDTPYTFDDNGQKVRKPLRPNNIEVLLSKTQQEVIDYIQQSPIERTTYKNIYDMCGTTLDKIKTSAHAEDFTRLKNDTIYITPARFAELIGKPRNEASSKEIARWQSYFGNKDGEIYIPVQRHPRDNRDSLHFMRVEFLPDDHKGFEIMMNIDTMKSKFNGDFDGDAVSLIAPTKFLNNYATLVNPYKNYAYSIVDDFMEGLITSASPVDNTSTLIHNLRNNTVISDKLTEDLETLHNFREGNILAHYEALKAQFTEHVKGEIEKVIPDNLDEKSKVDLLKNIIDDIYIVKPIPIYSTNTTDGTSMVFYTDFPALNKNSLNKSYKELYRNNSIASVDTLSRLDSASGEFQKDNIMYELANRLKNNKLKLNDSAMILSETSRRLVAKNVNHARTVILNRIEADYKGNKGLLKFFKTILPEGEGCTVQNIEAALRVIQTVKQIEMYQTKDLQTAVNMLHTEFKDDPDVKAMQRWLDANNGKSDNFDDDLSKFYYSIDDIIKLQNFKGNRVASRTETNIGELLDNSNKFTQTGFITLDDDESTDGTPAKSMQSKLNVLVRIKAPENTTVQEIGEDTFLLGPNHQTASIHVPATVKLSDAKFDKVKHKYFSDGTSGKLLTPKEAEQIGITIKGPYDIMLCTYDEPTQQILYHRVFNLAKAKIGVYGDKAFKATASSEVDTSQFPAAMQDHIQDVHIMYGPNVLDTKSGTSAYKPHDATYFDAEGNIVEQDATGTIPNTAVYMKTQEDISSLSSYPVWNKTLKETDINRLDIANSLEDTAGVWQTKGMFYKVHKTSGKNEYTLEYDDQGFQSFKKRLQEENSPNLRQHNASETYELLRFMLLCKYAKEDHPDDYDEYVQTNLSKAFDNNNNNSYLRDVNEMLAIKYKKKILQDSNDKLVSTLLLDNDLANRVYKKKGGIAEQNTNLTTKGSNTRHIISQSKKFTEEAPGGEFRQGLDIFPHVPNMSNCELINYINAKLGTGNQIYESSMQHLTEGNKLPVGEFRDTRLDGHDYISNDDNKIQNALGAPTRAFSGASILPADELGRDALQEYRLIKDAHGYKTTPLNATKPKSNNYSKKMIIMLKALIGDKDHNLNKYDLYDQLTANSKSYIYSVDIPQYSTDSDKGLVYKPQQYIDKETQLAGGISTRSVLEKLNSIRANTDYHTDLQKTSDSLQPELLATKSAPTITDVNTRVSPDHHNLTSTRRDPFKDHAAIIQEYKLLAGDLDEVQELNSKAPTVGSKVIQNHKVFENEKIMWNHGIKIKDADDLIQDRNIKQVSADMVNYRDNYSVDIVRLNNYAVNHDSVKSVNEMVYLIALQDQIKAVDNAISHTKDDTKRAQYQIQKDSLIASLEELGLKDLKEADTRLAQLQKSHQTEFYMVNKILTTLSEDTQKYNNLNGEPCGNISYLITNTAHADKKKRKASVKGILKSIGSKEPYTPDQKSSKYTLPVYNTFNFFDSISATVTQVAKRKAIYENSLRLRKEGVIDNSSTQRILNETFEKHIETIRTLDNQPEDNMRRSLISTWMYITEQLDSYISLDDSLVRNIEDAFSDGKTPIGSIYADIYLLLNNVMRQTGITYETASLDNVNKADARRFLLCNEIIQDIFACMSHLTKDQLLKDLTDNLINFADTKGLKLVDRFGKPIDPKHIYTTDEGSLAFIQRALDNRTESTYRQGLARDAIQGELYFMDAGLADAYSKTVFVKYKKPNWLMRTVQKTSNWCIKMLMASPFKLVDRFLKFSAFDMATLGSANAKTLAYQGKSFTDLKAYFMSKGSHKSTDLEEFLNSQGIRMNSDSFDLVLNTDPDTSVGLFKGYQDATGNWFTFQSLSQRYAYWLATKESLKKGDYSVLGSAYHLKDAISELKAITDSDGKVMVTKEGQQAAFAMAQMIGASNDFPGLSKSLNRYGMVFTTFPLAAARWGMGEFRSLNAAIKDMFTNGITSSGGLWLLRQGSGIVGTFIAEQLLVSLICDMFGVTDEEQEKEWKDVGALPNVTQTLIQGQPIMDTFSSMNILREFYGLTLEPFLSKDETKTDESTLLKGFERYLNKNIVSHINPIIKNLGEFATKKDLIDDQIISTDQKYNGFENVFRKLSSYVLGGAGANALTKELKDKSDGFPASFYRGMQKAINAELGNTKATKENTKNYYKMLNLVNEYRDYSNRDNTQWSNGDFNIAQYNQVKSKLYSLISSRASANEVYKALNEFRNQGYTAQELRSALKTCSLSERINKLSDSTEFLEALTESEKQNLQTALAYEEYMFPWIDDNVDVLNQYIKNKQQNSYNSTVSAPYYKTNYYSYKSNKLPTYANQSYNYFNHNAYTSPYKTYADSIKNLQNSYISSYNPYKNNTPTDAYNSLQHTIKYNAQQGGKY